MSKQINEISTKVGLNIKNLRLEKGLSQEKLAFFSDTSLSMISSIELGKKSPTVEKVAAIAKALDIELYKLFIFED